jgi:predicted CXXCH cytochrome family protein
MKIRARILFGVGVFLLIAVGYSLIKGPHEFEEDECSRCHIADPRGKESPLPLVASEKELCSDCHSINDALLNHPVDVVPAKAEVPPDMPLTIEGTVSCSTCHDIHSPYRTPFGTLTHFLRRQEQGRFYCAVCHKDKGREGKVGHTETFETVHYRLKYFVTDTRDTIDQVSAECLSCHDGSVGKLSLIGAGIWTHENDFMDFDMGMHPIGVYYRDAFSKRPDGYKPPSLLNEKIKLINGKLSCVSCHDIYSDIPMKLVVSNERSRLCLECHIK